MPQVDLVRLDLTGWTPSPTTSAAWTDESGDKLFLVGFDAPPNIPPLLHDPAALQSAWPPAFGGNLSVDVVAIDGVRCARVLSKLRADTTELVYLGALIIPRRDYSFVVRVQCNEGGITGGREAVVLTLLMDEGHEVPSVDSRMEGWHVGPEVEPPLAARNLADDERWDGRFPTHPLSRCRRHLDRLQATTSLDASIRSDAPFGPP